MKSTHAKRVYRFIHDDKIMTWEEYILLPDLTEQDKQERYKLMLQFYEAQEPLEREWRNDELTDTDKFMVSDATYKGEPVQESNHLFTLIRYRQELRNYDCLLSPRPVRPEYWT